MKIFKHLRSDWFHYGFETLAVVVGILIAFALDNWNEERKLRKDEISMLKNFTESLKDDLEAFEWPLEINPRVSNSIGVIIESIEKDLPYRDTLKYYFRNTAYLWAVNINESAFETLESKGLDVISNDHLRQQIIEVYDAGNTNYKNLVNEYRKLLLDASDQIYNTRFDEFWNVEVMVPLDFESLKKDQEYIYFIKTLRNKHRIWMVQNLNRMQVALATLLDEIELEIENLEK